MHTALLSVMAYTVILCLVLVKTGNFSKISLMHTKCGKGDDENGFVSVPKDSTKVKNKIIFNLTKRQLICLGIAAQ